MARTIQAIRLSLLLLSGTAQAAPLATDGASSAHRLLLFGGEETVRSGYYVLEDGGQKLGDLFLPSGTTSITRAPWALISMAMLGTMPLDTPRRPAHHG